MQCMLLGQSSHPESVLPAWKVLITDENKQRLKKNIDNQLFFNHFKPLLTQIAFPKFQCACVCSES